LKLQWTRPALNDLIEAQTYIAQDNPQAAQAVAQRLWDAAQSLTDHPQIGRPGHVADTREWVVRRTPYDRLPGTRGDPRNSAVVAHQT
jgi:toxin ParE1/3/4